MRNKSIAICLGLLATAFPILSPAQNAVPLEIEDHKPQPEPAKVPLVVINLNFNIGKNEVSTIAPTIAFGKKAKVERVKFHILKLQRKHDLFRALIQNEDGTNEWKDIPIEGLKYLSDDDVAWHYAEYDVFSSGKIVSRDRVLSIHRASFEAIINSQDGASLP